MASCKKLVCFCFLLIILSMCGIACKGSHPLLCLCASSAGQTCALLDQSIRGIHRCLESLALEILRSLQMQLSKGRFLSKKKSVEKERNGEKGGCVKLFKCLRVFFVILPVAACWFLNSAMLEILVG